MMSSSTCISFNLHCIVEIIMTSAFSTSHFLARKKRRRSASGWSCLTMLQKVFRSSSGGMLAIAALNSAVWPNLSSSADMDSLLMSVGAELSEVVEALSSAPFSPLFLLKTFRRLFFLSFLPSAGASLVVGEGASSSPFAPAPFTSSDPASTPKTFMTIPHSSRSFFSCSGVRLPGRPAGVLGAITRYESVRSPIANLAGRGAFACAAPGELCAKGTRSVPPIAMAATIPTVQKLIALFLGCIAAVFRRQ